jgi:hypothetical protein
MGFEWTEYLGVASLLRETASGLCSEQARLRSAVSRMYFGAYCYARNYARDRQTFTPTGAVDDHLLLLEHFRNRRRMREASALDNLRKWRNLCDYQDEVADLTLIVESAETAATSLIALLR